MDGERTHAGESNAAHGGASGGHPPRSSSRSSRSSNSSAILPVPLSTASDASHGLPLQPSSSTTRRLSRFASSGSSSISSAALSVATNGSAGLPSMAATMSRQSSCIVLGASSSNFSPLLRPSGATQLTRSVSLTPEFSPRSFGHRRVHSELMGSGAHVGTSVSAPSSSTGLPFQPSSSTTHSWLPRYNVHGTRSSGLLPLSPPAMSSGHPGLVALPGATQVTGTMSLMPEISPGSYSHRGPHDNELFSTTDYMDIDSSNKEEEEEDVVSLYLDIAKLDSLCADIDSFSGSAEPSGTATTPQEQARERSLLTPNLNSSSSARVIFGSSGSSSAGGELSGTAAAPQEHARALPLMTSNLGTIFSSRPRIGSYGPSSCSGGGESSRNAATSSEHAVPPPPLTANAGSSSGERLQILYQSAENSMMVRQETLLFGGQGAPSSSQLTFGAQGGSPPSQLILTGQGGSSSSQLPFGAQGGSPPSQLIFIDQGAPSSSQLPFGAQGGSPPSQHIFINQGAPSSSQLPFGAQGGSPSQFILSGQGGSSSSPPAALRDTRERKRRISNDQLSEIATQDPRRARRIVSNRIATTRSREKKMIYVRELHQQIDHLRELVSSLNAEVAEAKRKTEALETDQLELQSTLDNMKIHNQLEEALSDILTAELKRLTLKTEEHKTPAAQTPFAFADQQTYAYQVTQQMLMPPHDHVDQQQHTDPSRLIESLRQSLLQLLPPPMLPWNLQIAESMSMSQGLDTPPQEDEEEPMQPERAQTDDSSE